MDINENITVSFDVHDLRAFVEQQLGSKGLELPVDAALRITVQQGSGTYSGPFRSMSVPAKRKATSTKRSAS